MIENLQPPKRFGPWGFFRGGGNISFSGNPRLSSLMLYYNTRQNKRLVLGNGDVNLSVGEFYAFGVKVFLDVHAQRGLCVEEVA